MYAPKGDSTTSRQYQPAVYTLCCHGNKLHHAGHYTGYTTNITARMELHRRGMGAKLTKAYNDAGITYELTLYIPVKDAQEGHRLERWLKNKHCAARFCPLCLGKPLAPELALMQGHWPLAIHACVGKRQPMKGRQR